MRPVYDNRRQAFEKYRPSGQNQIDRRTSKPMVCRSEGCESKKNPVQWTSPCSAAPKCDRYRVHVYGRYYCRGLAVGSIYMGRLRWEFWGHGIPYTRLFALRGTERVPSLLQQTPSTQIPVSNFLKLSVKLTRMVLKTRFTRLKVENELTDKGSALPSDLFDSITRAEMDKDETARDRRKIQTRSFVWTVSAAIPSSASILLRKVFCQS